MDDQLACSMHCQRDTIAAMRYATMRWNSRGNEENPHDVES